MIESQLEWTILIFVGCALYFALMSMLIYCRKR